MYLNHVGNFTQIFQSELNFHLWNSNDMNSYEVFKKYIVIFKFYLLQY
jgi:hypothetical protein